MIQWTYLLSADLDKTLMIFSEVALYSCNIRVNPCAIPFDITLCFANKFHMPPIVLH